MQKSYFELESYFDRVYLIDQGVIVCESDSNYIFYQISDNGIIMLNKINSGIIFGFHETPFDLKTKGE